MACLKLGSKPDAFRRHEQTWFCSSGLPSDVTIKVQGVSFYLHKFPLVSRSGLLAQLLQGEEEVPVLQLSDVPGGADALELVARFCYGFRLEITASNVVVLRCTADYLQMNEDLGEGNLIATTDEFLHEVVLHQWKESIRALHSCEMVFVQAEKLGIVDACVNAVAIKACMDPHFLGCLKMFNSMQSPGGSLLWNGISTGAKPKKARADWWYDDATLLSLLLFKRVISAVEAHGVNPESIAGAVMHYGRRHLLDPNKHHRGNFSSPHVGAHESDCNKKAMLETIESLLPEQKGVVPTKFLSGLLRSAMILKATEGCQRSLEKRIGLQLEQAGLEDVLLPNLCDAVETLYDTDCMQRMLEHFVLLDQSAGVASSPSSVDEGPLLTSPSLTPLMMVARLMDAYLEEVAPDANLKPSKFISLATALPPYSRMCDDGLYRAIDIYLKAHPWVNEEDRELLCRVLDCQKLSLEACTHAAQNERLPLRMVVQVLFFEQLQLRTAIASCFMMSDCSRPLLNQASMMQGGALQSGPVRGHEWVPNAVQDNHILKVDMENMRLRVVDLEKECSSMRQELDKLGKLRGHWRLPGSKVVRAKLKLQVCNMKGDDMQEQHTKQNDTVVSHNPSPTISLHLKHSRSSSCT